MSDRLLPAAVYPLLEQAFPAAAIRDHAATSGGYSHRSAIIAIDNQLLMVKVADRSTPRADLRREAQVLTLLHSYALAGPRLVRLLENADWSALLSGYIAGTPGQQLYSLPATQIAWAYQQLGAYLADLHALAPDATGVASELDLGRRRRCLSAALPSLHLPADLRDLLIHAISAAGELPQLLRLTHGDPGLHNVIVGERELRCIDWEWAGWGHPLRDLAWLAWTIEFRRLPFELWQAFVAGYSPTHLAALAPQPSSLQHLALAQIAAILQRCPPGSPAQAEWLRRTVWSRSLDFAIYTQFTAHPAA